LSCLSEYLLNICSKIWLWNERRICSRNDCFSYLRNKSDRTLSQNLQISPICIMQADSKVLELKSKITELKSKVKCYMLCYDNTLLIC